MKSVIFCEIGPISVRNGSQSIKQALRITGIYLLLHFKVLLGVLHRMSWYTPPQNRAADEGAFQTVQLCSTERRLS